MGHSGLIAFLPHTFWVGGTITTSAMSVWSYVFFQDLGGFLWNLGIPLGFWDLHCKLTDITKLCVLLCPGNLYRVYTALCSKSPGIDSKFPATQGCV